jgi:hypothetical protein
MIVSSLVPLGIDCRRGCLHLPKLSSVPTVEAGCILYAQNPISSVSFGSNARLGMLYCGWLLTRPMSIGRIKYLFPDVDNSRTAQTMVVDDFPATVRSWYLAEDPDRTGCHQCNDRCTLATDCRAAELALPENDSFPTFDYFLFTGVYYLKRIKRI